ncbi:MAG: SDR family NAD(P)-dependent oxidoreductase [Pseudomonadota bacterium]
MTKTIVITGSTDGIGLQAAQRFLASGHHVILHGRDPGKLATAQDRLRQRDSTGSIDGYIADLSSFDDVDQLAKIVADAHPVIDVLINNAGVFKTPNSKTADDLDVRFMVNSIAPYQLTRQLLPSIVARGRIINLSSAAQAPVDLDAIGRFRGLADNAAYAQSKLAITMWSHHMATELPDDGPAVIAVNPGSFLGTKMVQEAYGMAGGDVRQGADILYRLALDSEHSSHSGDYFDNDAGRYAPPHPDALDMHKNRAVVGVIESVLEQRRALA